VTFLLEPERVARSSYPPATILTAMMILVIIVGIFPRYLFQLAAAIKPSVNPHIPVQANIA
jgi:hypothetical protein